MGESVTRGGEWPGRTAQQKPRKRPSNLCAQWEIPERSPGRPFGAPRPRVGFLSLRPDGHSSPKENLRALRARGEWLL